MRRATMFTVATASIAAVLAGLSVPVTGQAPVTAFEGARIIVGDNTAVKALAAMYDKTPLETLKTWQRFKVADQAGPYLSKRFVDSQFATELDPDLPLLVVNILLIYFLAWR